MTKVKRLQNRLRTKQAQRIELVEMLEGTKVYAASSRANPVRVRIRRKLIRLEEEIHLLEMQVFLEGWRPPDRGDASTKTLPARLRQRPACTSVVPVEEKLANPQRYPVLTLPETRLLVPVSRSTVYRWLDEGRLSRARLDRKPGKRSSVLIRTESVKKLLEEDDN